MKRTFLLLGLFFFLTHIAMAQSVKRLLSDAKKYVESKEYTTAIPLFEKALQQEPENAEALFGIGFSYLNGRHREKALPFLQKLYKTRPQFDKDLKGHLAEAYQINNLFKEADKLFKEMETDLKKRLELEFELIYLSKIYVLGSTFSDINQIKITKGDSAKFIIGFDEAVDFKIATNHDSTNINLFRNIAKNGIFKCYLNLISSYLNKKGLI